MKPEALIGKIPNLQSPSPTVVQLLNLLNDPDADFDEITATVRRDVALSVKLLAVCNSTSYGLAKQVASVEQAVLYLGHGEIHQLIMALSFSGPIGVELPGYDIEARTLWRHSLVTALVTPRVVGLSQQLNADTSTAYTAGLLHDIGKLVIGQSLDVPSRDRIHAFVEGGEGSLLAAEKAVLGCDHAEIGACLLRQWRLPEIIVEAVEHHHHPPVDGGAHLSAVVHVADALAHQTGASPGWGSFAIVFHEAVLTALQLTVADLETLTFAALDCQEKAAQQGKDAVAQKPESRAGAAAPRSF